ncbi:histone H2A deubiquitinase MYSM1 isoform X1 [Scleropages formosus]|uniref:Myb-like, SWIRM and MPN domain-containing protein 1 n=2 Tax=Scleropages formosus TaxID=113540 RepID=A0A8C9R0R6_SCLFO|nr:histone H2A deubiquitinase MYSM1 isoform X1 [Scleropages formosus]
MAEELEVVDVEGEGTEVNLSRDSEDGGVLQDQYLQSVWKANSGILPWTLDSSISAENREAIEKMLLEEEYYLAGKELPKNLWTGEKQRVKKSPVKPVGQPVRWAQEEKDLFEKGLAQFGRRWTKIAKMIGSRTVLQVKSYARQYFKNKAKIDNPLLKTSEVSWGSMSEPASNVKWTSGKSAEDRSAVLSNAVRIERLSDDEDVDVTDDLSDDAAPWESQPDLSEATSLEGPHNQTNASFSTQNSKPSLSTELSHDALPSGAKEGSADTRCDATPVVEEDSELAKPDSPGEMSMSEMEGKEETGQIEPVIGLDVEFEEDLKVPEQEVQLCRLDITEEEKQAISEFFEGRPSKTPERYLKIRNYILDQWEKCKPKYLNKTSVRPGLKNCGDVNCIGRIHTYLELIGAINFNCEQAIYNRPRTVERSRAKEARDTLEAYQLAQRLQSMRSRKRRVRDVWGNWCYPKDLEGHTYEHLSAEELAKRREEMKKQAKPVRVPRQRGSFDPFQLIPCQAFGQEKQEPFQVLVCAEALVVMDMHAHVSMGEVIGLLGGGYTEGEKVLKICAAEPCNSLSTGMQCEMDPVSQTQASELLAGRGYSVVGWYHSHPAFDPNPSVRDIDTQAKYQSYFSRGGAPFIGMIISPYNPSNPLPYSQTTCLVVSEEQGPSGSHKIPFRFEIHQSHEEPDWAQIMRRAEWVVHKYKQCHGSVPMDRFFRRDSHLTCLEKMLASLRKFLEQLEDCAVTAFLAQIESLFLSKFLTVNMTEQDDMHALSPHAELIEAFRFSASQSDSREELLASQALRTETLAFRESDSLDGVFSVLPVNTDQV